MAKNRRVLLAARPQGEPKLAYFRFDEQPVPEPAAGELLLGTVFVSLDPYVRGRMNGGEIVEHGEVKRLNRAAFAIHATLVDTMTTSHELTIRPAARADAEAIWQTLEPTIRAGEALALARDLTRREALGQWLAPDHDVFVAEQEGTIVGSYSLRESHAGGGAHVATSTYVVSPSATGRGIAQAMCEHSLVHARARGFLAMHFDFVVSTDERRVKLWQRAGFQIVGRLPKAFQHPSLGLVDALVMFREL